MQQIVVAIVQMHAIAKAKRIHFTVGAFAFFSPAAVTIFNKAAIPYIPKIVFVNITLYVIAANAAAPQNGAVNKNAAHRNARFAAKKVVPDFAFISAGKTVTGITDTDDIIFLRTGKS